MKISNISIEYIFLCFIFLINPCNGDGLKCAAMVNAYTASDCFELDFLSSDTEKCCLIEYKDKSSDDDMRKFRRCVELTLEQFLDIDKTINDYESANDNLTIYSLECDKSSFLTISKLLLFFGILFF